MEKLISEYKQGLKELKQAEVREEEKAIVNSMVSDMKYALEWMQTAKMPGNKRAIERRAAYQKEISVDPLEMQKFVYHEEQVQSTINSWEEEKIVACLSILSESQRECFYLHYGKMYSWQQIAEMMGVSKSTIQIHITRANKKIKQYLANKPIVQEIIYD
ncbi:sigma-70 family RNA polymerase sigma factor [Listeria monocytogenes]|uniref:sigma-70 family RNA polymerase sigma factor n=1 Tax=Listeria monocytogenes TaxID=1639 RepID=UPI003F9C663F|nr:sigma-70 family RNA polymerase sigma factor [Listeria monocytogenes]EIL5159760.1 sigma-70 family RNA polymerase sigma factor [Listeria monocytogenes]